jgi:hypothetical protein
MIASFARQSVTRLRAAETTDRYGNPSLDWSDPDEKTIQAVTVEPLGGSGASGAAAVMFDSEGGKLISRWNLHADSTADINTGDRIKYGGIIYDIDGAVFSQPSPSGRLDHLEILLKRTDSTDA